MLVNLADPNGELFGIPGGVGDPVTFDLSVPGDPALSGFVFYTQAASFVGGFCLHCAHSCTMGY
jgi:hypothetical protein